MSVLVESIGSYFSSGSLRDIKNVVLLVGVVIGSLHTRGAADELRREPEGSVAVRRQVAGHALKVSFGHLLIVSNFFASSQSFL